LIAKANVMSESNVHESAGVHVPLWKRARDAWDRFYRQGQLPPAITCVWEESGIQLDISIHDWRLRLGRFAAQPLPAQGSPRVHIYYPTYSAHFDYLLASVRSLLRLNPPQLGKIYVYQDNGAPLLAAQAEELRRVLGDRLVLRRFKRRYRFSRQVLCNFEAWSEIAGEIGADDWVAKCDSDVLWVRTAVLERVVAGGIDLLGHACTTTVQLENFIFCQGGLYLVQAGLLSRIAATPVGPLLREKMRRLIPSYDLRLFCPEDAATCAVAGELQARIELGVLYLKSLADAPAACGLESILHYEGNLTKADLLRDAQLLK
jgi:hypothetical protein